MVSGYFYRINGGSKNKGDLKRAKLYPKSFKKFCEKIEYFMNLEKEHMFIPQWEWISDSNGNLIIDYIGRFESLEKDYETICSYIGYRKGDLPHINKSNHRPYWLYYDDETRQIIAEIFKRDIDYFGYSFDNVGWFQSKKFLLKKILNQEKFQSQ